MEFTTNISRNYSNNVVLRTKVTELWPVPRLEEYSNFPSLQLRSPRRNSPQNRHKPELDGAYKKQSSQLAIKLSDLLPFFVPLL
jgi:hypothetical protein